LKEAITQNELSFHQHLSENLKNVTEGAQEIEELFYNSRLLYFLENITQTFDQFHRFTVHFSSLSFFTPTHALSHIIMY
jgi:hypothetical protein